MTALGLLGPMSPAHGHAALTGSDPQDGAQLSSAPTTVTVSYAEPPTQNSRFAVLDGCERDVAASIEILNDTIEATIGEAQPGEWTVEWSVVSAVDGHLTRDDVAFQVEGKPDCTQAAPERER
jgi:copper transport protein